jgi:hypothetical protein
MRRRAPARAVSSYAAPSAARAASPVREQQGRENARQGAQGCITCWTHCGSAIAPDYPYVSESGHDLDANPAVVRAPSRTRWVTSRRDGGLEHFTDRRALLIHAWRSSPAATGDVAAPSQMEQSTEVAGGPSQLVLSGTEGDVGGDSRFAGKQECRTSGSQPSCAAITRNG